MELIEMITTEQVFYETVQWATLIVINQIMLLFAYWIADVGSIMVSRNRRLVAYTLATLCAGVGVWRMVAIVIYFDSFTARLTVPITAALTWSVIGVLGYAGHRYIKRVNERFLAKKENIELMEAVQQDIVIPLLRGETVPKERIAAYKAKSVAFSSK